MQIVVPDDRPTAKERMKADAAAEAGAKPINLTGTRTALSASLSERQAAWLLQHASDRWLALHGNLSSWRAKMEKWERIAEDDYSHRIGQVDPDSGEAVADIFSLQNETLGLSDGFATFAAAQARNDIFGTRPWLAATPEGSDDVGLAERITKHAQWKFQHSDMEEALTDAIRTACWGGTAFVKGRWVREVEEYSKLITAAHLISTGEALLGPDGDYLTEAEQIPEDVDGEDIEWKEIPVTETATTFDNVSVAVMDWKDIAFDAKAPRLELAHTDVFCRFRMGLLDVAAAYDLTEQQVEDLKLAVVGADEEARDHRDESSAEDKTPFVDEDEANPLVSLVEGFLRCDPKGSGRPARIHCVFSPDLQVMFACDYLANVTPGGVLPVFPVRVHKIPRRIFGRGYLEKYESANDSVDRQHNAVTYRNKIGSHVFTAFQPAALLDDGEGQDLTLNSRKPFVLKPDMTIDDLIAFKAMPDLNNRSIELMNNQMQMAQMRSGITSAAQGELKGVPNASTATGVAQIQSRGALLLKDPIDQLTMDLRPAVEYAVHLLYANHDHDETFTWGEGKDAELLQVKAGDVQGLRMNVSLTLVQAQNQAKLASAQTAIQIAMGYATLPEVEKVAQRRLYVQAISSLGFHEAEEIIRQATVDPAGILQLVPPEVAPYIEEALIAAGVLPPEAPPEGEMEGADEPAPAPVIPPEEM